MNILLLLVVQSAFGLQTNVPAVDLDFWNVPERVSSNNCYNYATNRETDSFAQPGEASGKVMDEISCKAVYEDAKSDLGLVPADFFPFAGKHDDSLIALVVAPNEDFHWYRRGDDGLWTHKIGPAEAGRTDADGKIITSPETASRGDYTDFCGYFRIKDYIYESDEQNGGYVRIGNMKQLPAEPTESQVVVLKYSGRPNPVFSLRRFVQENPALQTELLGLRTQLQTAPKQMVFSSLPAKLGYNGIVIVDREGLVFSKGSRLQISGTEVFAQMSGTPGGVHLSLAQPLAIESAARYSK